MAKNQNDMEKRQADPKPKARSLKLKAQQSDQFFNR